MRKTPLKRSQTPIRRYRRLPAILVAKNKAVL
jgi:hypothetical protein